MDKEAKIKKELRSLKKIFKDLPDNKMVMATRLMEKAAFMKATLEELEETVNEKGPTYLMKQGSQILYVEHPAQKSYNTMINRYQAVMKQLYTILESETAVVKTEESDGFDEFLET